MSEPLNFKIENFDGPLDLLLHLIDSNKIDIYDIPISSIFAQFRAYMDSLPETDLDKLSDFILMASELMNIKTKMLLPKEINEETGEEIDPRAELVKRLIEYRKVKLVSARLQAMFEDNQYCCFREPEKIEAESKYDEADLEEAFRNVSLASLQKVFERVMEKNRDRLDTQRMGFSTIKKEAFSVKGKICSLLSFAKTHRKFSFSEIIENNNSKVECIVTFLSVLELAKSGKVLLIQQDEKDDIQVEVVVEEAELNESDLSVLEGFS